MVLREEGLLVIVGIFVVLLLLLPLLLLSPQRWLKLFLRSLLLRLQTNDLIVADTDVHYTLVCLYLQCTLWACLW